MWSAWTAAKCATSLLGAVGLAAVLVLAAAVTRRIWIWSAWLKDVPGPPSRSWLLGHWRDFAEEDLVQACLRWTAQYGGVVKIRAFFGEPRLLVTDPLAIHHVCVSRPYNYPRQHESSRVLRNIMGSGLIVAEGVDHRRQRRALQPAFSPTAIRAMGPHFVRHAAKLRRLMLHHLDDPGIHGQGTPAEAPIAAADAASGGPGATALCDVLLPLGRATLDILGDAGFGYQIGALDEPGLMQGPAPKHDSRQDASAEESRGGEGVANRRVSANELARAFDEVWRLATNMTWAKLALEALMMFLPPLEVLPFAERSPDMRRAQSVLLSKARQVVATADEDLGRDGVDADADEGRGTRRRDLLATMMRASAEAERGREKEGPTTSRTSSKATLTREEMVAQVSTIMFTGFETTSITITRTLLALARDAEVQSRLRREIRAQRAELGLSERPRHGSDSDSVPDVDRELTLEELEHLPYLDWVVKEGVRLYAPLHTTSKVAAEDDVLPVHPEYSPALPRHGVVVRKGTLVFISIEGVNRSVRVWGPDVDEFRPDRWREPPGALKLYSASSTPFSFLAGPRACIGSRFSTSVIKVILASLVNDLEFLDGGNRIVPLRWIMSRVWDCHAGREQCPLRIRRAA